MKEMWGAMDRRARVMVIAGSAAAVLACSALGMWAYRTNYQVLFADLAPRDAAAMTAELDKLKTPYRLAGDGHTILVPEEQVYKLRLKLMGTDAPLYGAVGFEVFNNTDLGMTEFVQKVNYQRAIQGELTRTIQAIEEVQSARVHLAIPEQGLFKRSQAKAKASVTLAVKPGHTLTAEQVTGIQRLVAASVPDVAQPDVTVLDQHGRALTRTAGDAPAEGAGAQLDSKRSTEEYLLKKVNAMLDRTFGEGRAVASVDVVLNLDQAKVTTEEVLPVRGATSSDGEPAGVVVRERHSSQGDDAASENTAEASAATGASSSEADYQVGRRVEQVAVASGTVRRMTVAVLVRQELSELQMAQLKDVVSSAIGINPQRGDVVVVHSMDKFGALPADAGALAAPAALDAEMRQVPAAAPKQAAGPDQAERVLVLAGLCVLAIVVAALLLSRSRRLPARKEPPQLDDAARAAMLQQVRTWIASDATVHGKEVR